MLFRSVLAAFDSDIPDNVVCNGCSCSCICNYGIGFDSALCHSDGSWYSGWYLSFHLLCTEPVGLVAEAAWCGNTESNSEEKEEGNRISQFLNRKEAGRICEAAYPPAFLFWWRDTSRRQLKSFSVQQFYKNAAEVWASSPHLRSKLNFAICFSCCNCIFENCPIQAKLNHENQGCKFEQGNGAIAACW